jgi:multidrug efflux pump subunit AcrA (membrane-fusion protein)
MKTFKNNKFMWIFIAVVLAGVVYWFQGRGPKGPDLDSAKVIRQDVIQRVTISGNVVPFRKTVITGPYKGYIRKMYVKIGDKVKVGDPIASVSTSLTVNDPAFPLRAPFAGVVVAVEKSEGEFVKESDPTDFIARIDDLSKFYIEAVAPEIERVKMKVGQEAIVRASAILDRTYKAVVREISLASKEKERWERGTGVDYTLRLEITDPDAQISSGMSVLIDIVAQKKEKALFIRHEFINKNGDTYFARLKDGTTRDLKLGLQNEEGAEVLSGLKEGDVIKKVDFLEEAEKK